MDLLAVRSLLSSGKSIFEMPLRVAYYARVSTDTTQQLNSLDNQTFYFDEYISKNSFWTLSGAYVDEGLSGTSTSKRLSFLKMIKDGKSGKYDLIITKEISRFARDTLDSIQFTRELLSCGVGVYFQSDNINTLLPDAELRLTIMASIAQDEVRKLSERLRFGYKRSIERGRVLGQNNLLGYNKNDGKLSINQDQSKIVKRIFELYIDGKIGIRRIAQQLEKESLLSPFTGKMLSPETVKNVITNPKYKGYYCSGKTISIDHRNNKRIRVASQEWNVHKDENIPAIVSEEVWDLANRIYLERSSITKENGQACQSRYPFSGKIFCEEHSTSYHRHVYKSKKNGEQEVWNCKLYRQKGKIDGCDSPTIYSRELHEILNNIYKNVYTQKATVINGLMKIYSSIESKDFNQEISKFEKEKDKIIAKKDILLDLNLDGSISKSELVERNNSLNFENERLTNIISEYKKELELSVVNRQNLTLLKKSLEKEFSQQSNFQAELSSVLLDKIIVHRINNSKNHLQLEICLNIGRLYTAELNENTVFSLNEIGISQAQVSRLEKNAIGQIKKYI